MSKRVRRNRGYAEEAFSRIMFTTDDGAAARDADFVIENVPEDPALKGRVFAQFNTLCPERTIFTTNTSTLLPSMFAKETGIPGNSPRFIFTMCV